MATSNNANDLNWQPIHKAPADKWLLLRGSSGRRDGVKRYVSARRETERGEDWCNQWRTIDGDRVTDGGVMPSEFVEINHE